MKKAKAEETKKLIREAAYKLLLYPNTQTAIIRGYIDLVLKAEEYYPDFSTHIYQIIQNELHLWESVLTHANKEKGEIKSTCDISLLARLFRNPAGSPEMSTRRFVYHGRVWYGLYGPVPVFLERLHQCGDRVQPLP